MGNRWLDENANPGASYDERFRHLEAAGVAIHGEADLVTFLLAGRGWVGGGGGNGEPRVLDAGCGTGRVAIELARRGIDVTGVDLDTSMLAEARAKAPALAWIQGDLSDPVLDLGSVFDLVVAAGNVMIFLTPGTEAEVAANLAHQLKPGGLLVAGFQLQPGAGRLSLRRYDDVCHAAGLVLDQRWSTWDRQPLAARPDYAVSVHLLG